MTIRKRKPYIPINYSVPRAVMDILIDALESIHLFESPYNHLKRKWKESMGIPPPERWRYNRAVRYLERIGRVKVSRNGDRVFLELTKKGRLQGLLDRVQKSSFTDQKWDGKWRLVIWDIPEASNSERNKIRYFLKSLGFHKLQQSVYIRPYPIAQDAIEYLKESELIKFIRFLRVDSIDDEAEIRAKFELSSLTERRS